jgi:hypothetical protein
LTKYTKREEKQKSKLENLIIGREQAPIKEVYITFELPEHKKKCIENNIEIGEFITKVKDPSKKKLM